MHASSIVGQCARSGTYSTIGLKILTRKTSRKNWFKNAITKHNRSFFCRCYIIFLPLLHASIITMNTFKDLVMSALSPQSQQRRQQQLQQQMMMCHAPGSSSNSVGQRDLSGEVAVSAVSTASVSSLSGNMSHGEDVWKRKYDECAEENMRLLMQLDCAGRNKVGLGKNNQSVYKTAGPDMTNRTALYNWVTFKLWPHYKILYLRGDWTTYDEDHPHDFAAQVMAVITVPKAFVQIKGEYYKRFALPTVSAKLSSLRTNYVAKCKNVYQSKSEWYSMLCRVLCWLQRRNVPHILLFLHVVPGTTPMLSLQSLIAVGRTSTTLQRDSRRCWQWLTTGMSYPRTLVRPFLFTTSFITTLLRFTDAPLWRGGSMQIGTCPFLTR